MVRTSKVAPALALASLGIIAGGAIAQVVKIRSDAEKLQAKVQPWVSSIGWERVDLDLDILVKNPTRSRFKFSFPQVEIYLGNTLVARSLGKDQRILIPAQSTKAIENMIVSVDVVEAAAASAGAFFGLIGGSLNEIPATVRILTTAYAEIVGIPIRKEIVILESVMIKLKNLLP